MAMPAFSLDNERLWTAHELLTMPDDHMRHELVRGELRTMTLAGGPHGLVGMRLAVLLARHVEENDLGLVFSADTGFWLFKSPDTVRAPDIAFLSNARIPSGGIGRGYVQVAPDLAVEVLSPDDTVFEVEEKVREYLVAGTRLVWVINPKTRIVTEHRLNAPHHVVMTGGMLDGGDVVPGFACTVADVFTWADKGRT